MQQVFIETTETLLSQDTDRALATLNDLKKLGVHVAMDDFGTGYSSLSYLQRFPFDKIIQSFIAKLTPALRLLLSSARSSTLAAA